MGELDVESASNLYVTMRDFYASVSGYTSGYDPIMDELRGWFGILVDRWLDQLAVNLDKEFGKASGGVVTDANHMFTRMDQLSEQIRSRPCSAAQIQRFATLLKTVIKQCIDKVNSNVVSLLSVMSPFLPSFLLPLCINANCWTCLKYSHLMVACVCHVS
jgi:hypothetical protein